MSDDNQSRVDAYMHLARIRIRIMRSQMAMNQAIMDSYNHHTMILMEAVAEIERDMMHVDVAEVIRTIPTMRPPMLMRQHGGFISAADATALIDEDINNANGLLPQ